MEQKASGKKAKRGASLFETGIKYVLFCGHYVVLSSSQGQRPYAFKFPTKFNFEIVEVA
jgi:hypothetical protein